MESDACSEEGVPLLNLASQYAPPPTPTDSLPRMRSFDRDTVEVIDITAQERNRKVRLYCDVCDETNEVAAWEALERNGFVVRAALNAHFDLARRARN